MNYGRQPATNVRTIGRLHVDVTACWERRGAPVGISRVVTELARAVQQVSPDSQPWRYDRVIRRLVPVTWADFDRLIAAAPARRRRPAMVARLLTRARDMARGLSARFGATRCGGADMPAFGPGDRYVFGDWVGDGARLALYRSMIADGATMILYCHDVIPLLYPAFVEPETRRCFAPYLTTLLRPETRLICNSHTTLADLARVATVPDGVRVIPPGSDIANVVGEAIHRPELDRGYLLYVSTLEPRKNHRLLIDAYKRLIAAGRSDLPLLVFVGQRGWMVDDLLCDIDRGTGAAAYVRILERVSDRDLRDLYCRAAFIVFPSLYEGWGMPVSEAIALGRFCLCSNRGALPEAGAGFAELLDPLDSSVWAGRIAYYWDHPDAVRDRERTIRADHRPRLWSDFRREAMTALADG